MTNHSAPSFEDAFRDEYERQFASLFRYLDRLCGDPDLANDIAQETFVRLYRRGALPVNPRSWLLVVARNLISNEISKSRRRRRLLEGQRARLTIGDAISSPDADIESAQRRARVRSALDRLPRRERDLLLLRYEGYSYKEIARALDINEASVGTLLVRAKDAFRRAIEETGHATP